MIVWFQFIQHTLLDIQFMVIPIIHPYHTTSHNLTQAVLCHHLLLMLRLNLLKKKQRKILLLKK